MKELTKDQVQAKRAEAQALAVTLHVGKNGVTDATIEELRAQLRKKKLVKVRLLRAALGEEGEEGKESKTMEAQAARLAQGSQGVLIELRGHTAVFWHR
jgi:RNA-binding protein